MNVDAGVAVANSAVAARAADAEEQTTARVRQAAVTQVRAAKPSRATGPEEQAGKPQCPQPSGKRAKEVDNINIRDIHIPMKKTKNHQAKTPGATATVMASAVDTTWFNQPQLLSTHQKAVEELVRNNPDVRRWNIVVSQHAQPHYLH